MEVDGNKPKIYYHREGNLFLVDETNARQSRRALICKKAWAAGLSGGRLKKLKKGFRCMKPAIFSGGTYGPDDGHFDAYAALMGYKAKARSQGAEYLANDVDKIETRAGRVTGVRLASAESLSDPVYHQLCGRLGRPGGCHSRGVNLPVVPIKRQVFTLDTAVKPEGPLPLTVLPSGLYFRTETGGVILLGKSMAEDPTGFNFTWDDKRFMENSGPNWPNLCRPLTGSNWCGDGPVFMPSTPWTAMPFWANGRKFRASF